jgi:diphthine-ammonia ligase
MPKVFASWSGGKDCSLALNRALAEGLEVCCLANTITADGQRSCSHGMSAAVIRAQADAMGIPVLQQPTAGDNYRDQFIKMLRRFKAEGITGGVFGDIDFNPHREWIEGVCNETGMSAYLPLWGEDQRRLMLEFIDSGFVAVVVAVRSDVFGPEMLGKRIDRKFLDSLDKSVTPCGEAGEYHSLVIDGPFFKKSLAITASEKVTRGDRHFLEINGFELRTKRVKKVVPA